MIRKTSETRPLAGNITSAYNDSQTSAYSTEYANQHFGGTILWTNPNPTSSFAPQTISLDLSGYNYIEIKARHYSSTNSFLYQKFDIPSNDAKFFYCNNSEVEAREIITSSTGVEFKNCYARGWTNIGNEEVLNGRLIPQQIIGYK